ncbi:MAG: response regulator [Nitrospirota bacterium]|jgi:two-component system chemotaxis response regulator CheY
MAKTILIVDDAASTRQLVAYTLRDAGYEVIEAANGVDGLEKAIARHLDLVITDIDLPMLDGLELVRALRHCANFTHTPILLLTTESAVEMKRRAKELGATGWLVKPFDPKALVRVVHQVVETDDAPRVTTTAR